MAKTLSLVQVHDILDKKLKALNDDYRKAAADAGVSYELMFKVAHWERQPRGKVLDWIGVERTMVETYRKKAEVKA